MLCKYEDLNSTLQHSHEVTHSYMGVTITSVFLWQNETGESLETCSLE